MDNSVVPEDVQKIMEVIRQNTDKKIYENIKKIVNKKYSENVQYQDKIKACVSSIREWVKKHPILNERFTIPIKDTMEFRGYFRELNGEILYTIEDGTVSKYRYEHLLNNFLRYGENWKDITNLIEKEGLRKIQELKVAIEVIRQMINDLSSMFQNSHQAYKDIRDKFIYGDGYNQ